MASRKVNTEGIDEELLIASIGKKRSEEQMPPPVQEQSVQGQEEKSYAPTRRDAGGKKKQQDDDYIGLYQDPAVRVYQQGCPQRHPEDSQQHRPGGHDSGRIHRHRPAVPPATAQGPHQRTVQETKRQFDLTTVLTSKISRQ